MYNSNFVFLLKICLKYDIDQQYILFINIFDDNKLSNVFYLY